MNFFPARCSRAPQRVAHSPIVRRRHYGANVMAPILCRHFRPFACVVFKGRFLFCSATVRSRSTHSRSVRSCSARICSTRSRSAYMMARLPCKRPGELRRVEKENDMAGRRRRAPRVLTDTGGYSAFASGRGKSASISAESLGRSVSQGLTTGFSCPEKDPHSQADLRPRQGR